MMTVTNKLATHLVVPDGAGEKQPLKLAPKGEAKIEKISASLKDAETRGLIAIGYPTVEKASGKASKTKED
jgi:hypothetical protein